MQLADLAKLDQKIPVLAKLYSSNLFKDFSALPMGEDSIIVHTFLFHEQLVLFCVVVKKGAIVEEAQRLIQNEQASLVKVLEMLHFE